MSLFRSIRFKTLSLMTVCVFSLFVVITLVTTRIISNGFSSIENQKINENLGRVSDVYKFDLANLGTKMADWSAWDDTYRFIVDKNTSFKESNLVYSTLVNLKINYMIFVDTNGEIVESIGINDSTRGRLGEIPDDLKGLVFKDSALVTHLDETSQKTGLVMLNSGPLMFASRPIITSNGKGPVRGTVLFARYLDDEEIKGISDLTHLNVSAIRADKSLPQELSAIRDHLLLGESGYIKTQSSSISSGFTMVKDFFGKPAVIFKIDYPRDITIQGYKSVTYFIYAFIIAGLVFIFVLEFFLTKFLINRIEELTREITEMGESGYHGQSVVIGREKDEIALLSTRINEVLYKLSSSRKEALEEREKVNTFFDIVSGIVVVLSRGGKILSINKKGCEFLGVSEDGALGRDWLEFVPENNKELVKKVLREIVEYGDIEKYAYFEHPVVDRTGNQVMFGWYNSVLRDAKDQIIATVSHGEDMAKIGS